VSNVLNEPLDFSSCLPFLRVGALLKRESTRVIVQSAGDSVPNAPMEWSIPMQDTKTPESQCHYSDCASPAVKTCRKCHHSFCARHIHRQLWSYICDFCLWEKAAGHTPIEDAPMEGVVERIREREEHKGLRFIPDYQEKIDEHDQ